MSRWGNALYVSTIVFVTLEEPNGGNYLRAYRKSAGHAIHVDSQMNCRTSAAGSSPTAAPTGPVSCQSDSSGGF